MCVFMCVCGGGFCAFPIFSTILYEDLNCEKGYRERQRERDTYRKRQRQKQKGRMMNENILILKRVFGVGGFQAICSLAFRLLKRRFSRFSQSFPLIASVLGVFLI